MGKHIVRKMQHPSEWPGVILAVVVSKSWLFYSNWLRPCGVYSDGSATENNENIVGHLTNWC